MTTKPKTRKPAARRPAPKRAAVPADDVTVHGGKAAGESSDIRTLIARWNFLEAEAEWQKARTNSTHWPLVHGEQGEIRRKLLGLVPANFGEAFALFDFAMARLACHFTYKDDSARDIKLLKAVRAGLRNARDQEWGQMAAESALAAVRARNEAFQDRMELEG